MALCLAAAPAAELQAAAAAGTAVSAAVKKGLKIEKGKRYYYVNGVKLKNRWKNIGTSKYYFGADGAAKTGWYSIGSKSYYFNSRGILQAKFTKKMDKALLTKMDEIIKSQKITDKTSDSAALTRLFRYMRDKCGYARTMNFTGAKGWDAQYAKAMLTSQKGSCYHFAAAYAYLVKRATGLPVRIGWGESNAFNQDKWQFHAWCEVQLNGVWYTFDPNVAFAKKQNPTGVRLTAAQCYKQKGSAMWNKVYRRAKGKNRIQYVEVKL